MRVFLDSLFLIKIRLKKEVRASYMHNGEIKFEDEILHEISHERNVSKNFEQIKIEKAQLADDFFKGAILVESTTSICYKCVTNWESIDALIMKKEDALFIKKLCNTCWTYVEELWLQWIVDNEQNIKEADLPRTITKTTFFQKIIETFLFLLSWWMMILGIVWIMFWFFIFILWEVWLFMLYFMCWTLLFWTGIWLFKLLKIK